MATIAPTLPAKHSARSQPAEPNYIEILEQVEKIATSPHFRNSKRYPAFLKFVVEHTLAGQVDVLKERTLGIEVFGRPHNYDTNDDPVVRVTAGEIRKRIAQYYRAEGHEGELRIELPVGSYVPQFFASSIGQVESRPEIEGVATSPEVQDDLREAVSSTPEEGSILVDTTRPTSGRTVAKRRFSLFSAVGLLLLSLIVTGTLLGIHLWRDRLSPKGIDYFWKPVLATDNTALIVIGVHSLDPSGKDLSPETLMSSRSVDKQNMLSSMIRSDMVPVSDIVSYSELTKLLTERGHAYRTQGSSDTTFGQLQRGPVILIGGFDNVWTLRLTSKLRYRFVNPGARVGVIVDSDGPATNWSFDNGQSALSNTRDYAIVASFFDPRIEQRVLIAAGIGKSGTAAATEFLTNNNYLDAWLSQTKPSKSKNVEIVLSTEIVEGQQGPPQIVASYSW
jgi:hypothetical protein